MKGEQHLIRLLVGNFRLVGKSRSPTVPKERREEKKQQKDRRNVEPPPGPTFLVLTFISRSVDDSERDS